MQSLATNNVLHRITQNENGFWKPERYKHTMGMLVWCVTENLFGIYKVGSGWEFIDAEAWRNRYLTSPPVHLGASQMAILSRLIVRNRRMTVEVESLNRDTLVHGLRTACDSYIRFSAKRRQGRAAVPAA